MPGADEIEGGIRRPEPTHVEDCRQPALLHEDVAGHEIAMSHGVVGLSRQLPEPRPELPQPEDIEEEFPLGDGTAETEAIVHCPHCGEANEVTLDPGSGDDQEYVEDCEFCCRPWMVLVHYEPDGHAWVRVDPLVE